MILTTLTMSRSKEYQKLLNSRRWRELRARKLEASPLCERCLREGFIRSAVDIHHKVPVESAKTNQGMKALCYDWGNLEALCIPCHVETHKEVRSHTREQHKQRAQDRLRQWIDRHRPPGHDEGAGK